MSRMAGVAQRLREKPREANDFYKTPIECTQALLSVETIPDVRAAERKSLTEAAG
jgi:hypothetical protein